MKYGRKFASVVIGILAVMVLAILGMVFGKDVAVACGAIATMVTAFLGAHAAADFRTPAVSTPPVSG